MTLIVDISFQKSEKSRRVVLKENDELLVGRQNEKTLLSSDPRMSRRHFSIRLRDGEIHIEHLSKTNPTLLAPEDSSDFQPIRGRQTETQSCRIIAGFHRFILTLEGSQTTAQTSIGDIAGAGWGDVDDDDEVATFAEPQSFSNPRQTRPDSSPAPFRFDDSLDEDPSRKTGPAKPRPALNLFESEQPPSKSDSRTSDTFKSRDPDTSDFFINQSKPPAQRGSAAKRSDNQTPAPSESKPRKSSDPPKKEAEQPARRESKQFIDFDDESQLKPKGPATPPVPAKKTESENQKSEDEKAKSPPENDFPRKLNFPVADNFFDD